MSNGTYQQKCKLDEMETKPNPPFRPGLLAQICGIWREEYVVLAGDHVVLWC
jgi:hypothetical protein